MGIKLKKVDVERIIMGGAILGGGGGGWMEEGLKLAKLALKKGFHEILSIDEMDENSFLLTVSAVGAPSAGCDTIRPEDYVRAVNLFLEKTDLKIGGLISSEIGAIGVVNGWIQSACTGIPVIDSPCNGRAHPTGLMGSMNLHKDKNYISIQAIVGGDLKKGTRIEAVLSGSILKVSQLVREASVITEGMVAVARNPVTSSYVRKFGAPGAIKMAMDIGNLFCEEIGKKRIFKLIEFFGEGKIFQGRVKDLHRERKGGFDIGSFKIIEDSSKLSIVFLNEYLLLEKNGERIGTFPDLIMTFDSYDFHPLISAEIKEGMDITVLWVPWNKLKIGSGALDRELLLQLERWAGVKIII